MGEVADKFLACGILEHGFARVLCDACAHEYLLAFSCKGRAPPVHNGSGTERPQALLSVSR